METRFGQFIIKENIGPARTQDIQRAAEPLAQSFDYLDQQGIDVFVTQKACSTEMAVEAASRDNPDAKLSMTLSYYAPAYAVDTALVTGMKLLQQNTRQDVSSEFRKMKQELDTMKAVRNGGWSH